MPCSWMAISETAFGAEGSPRRATTRARGRPWARAAPTCSASTSSPSRAPARSPGATSQSRSVRLSIAAMRPPRLALVVDADDAPRAHADAADDPRGERRRRVVDGVMRAEQPVAGAERRGRRGGCRTRMRGGGPSPSHSAGSAQRSPAASAPVTRSTSTGGSSPCGPDPAAALLDAGRRGSSRASSCFSSTLAAPFSPKARAISRLPVCVGVVAQPGEDLVGRREVCSSGRRFIGPARR